MYKEKQRYKKTPYKNAHTRTHTQKQAVVSNFGVFTNKQLKRKLV